MPTYDYVCEACDHEFELFQQISEPVKKKCPACSKLKLRRLFGTGAAVVFKGSGFYETDYRSDTYKKDAKKDTDSQSGEKKSSDKKSGDAASEKKGSSDKSTSNKPAAKKPADKK